ncbi:Arylsulfatase [Urbifossiella limnaea]|uniref:Arylsulfatase n=1 Tax=Urbifossiella limnaea TaxID=2528023 RepID=A0A517XXE5_9BACT|nr:Arylsulfatase [Urbifossiella limnaea]
MRITPRAWALVAAIVLPGTTVASEIRPPNVVLIVADDLGYGDLGCYGAKKLRTPHLDQLAAKGTRFSSFYVSQPVCTASRASLLTGCYANRVSLFGALNHQSTVGLHPAERLLPELLREAGYATAIYGKWHLGDRPPFLPTRRGFDDFAGLPYSNDNGPLHPTMPGLPPLPFLRGERVIETNPDQGRFTRRFTDLAVEFIGANAHRPFILYLPHVMPHVPIFASPEWRHRSAAGVYGDVVEELDSGVGEVLAAVRRHGLEANTLVLFISDNGPFLSYGSHAGSAGPLREGKLTTWEGGVRVPGIAYWPGRVPAGRVCDEPVMTIDLLPTLVRLAGAKSPALPIDGKDVGPILLGEPNARSPHAAYFFYAGDELHAVRAGRWKLHLPHDYLTVNGPPGEGGKPANWGRAKPEAMSVSGLRGIASRHGYRVERTGQALYDLHADAGETRDVAAAHPDVVRELLAHAERARAELGDALTRRKGTGVRPCGDLKP